MLPSRYCFFFESKYIQSPSGANYPPTVRTVKGLHGPGMRPHHGRTLWPHLRRHGRGGSLAGPYTTTANQPSNWVMGFGAGTVNYCGSMAGCQDISGMLQ